MQLADVVEVGRVDHEFIRQERISAGQECGDIGAGYGFVAAPLRHVHLAGQLEGGNGFRLLVHGENVGQAVPGALEKHFRRGKMHGRLAQDPGRRGEHLALDGQPAHGRLAHQAMDPVPLVTLLIAGRINADDADGAVPQRRVQLLAPGCEMGAFLAGKVVWLAADEYGHLALHVHVLIVVVLQFRRIDAVAHEHHVGCQVAFGMRPGRAHEELLGELQLVFTPAAPHAQPCAVRLLPGAAQGHRLQVTTVRAGRLQPQLAKLADHVPGRDVVALGPGLPPPEQVIGQEPHVGPQALL